jgi:hypothetical protein
MEGNRMKTITIEMPNEELAEEFWAWWLDGGGEATMYECLPDEVGASMFNTEPLHIKYMLNED